MTTLREAAVRTGPTLRQRVLRCLGQSHIPKAEAILWRLGALGVSAHNQFTVPFAGMQYSGRFDQFVDRHIYYLGAYAPDELAFLDRAAAVIRAQRGALQFVDVGANVGQHSLFMASRADRVVAFEPNDEVADRLSENLLLNRICNVDLFRFALGDEAQIGTLGSGLSDNSGSRSLVWSSDHSKDIPVTVKNSDAAIAETGIGRVDLLKIDVEGFEKCVLEGLRGTLRRDRPVMLFELVGSGTKGGFQSESELRDSLYCDHHLFTIEAADPLKLSRFHWGSEEAVCLPSELLPAFRAVMEFGAS